MKKDLIIIISIILVVILGIFIYSNILKTDTGADKPISLSSTEGITTVLTLEDKIQSDTIWCGTFQLIWNDLKNDLAKQDIVFYDYPELQVVKNLNKETFTTNDISDQYYYKKIGIPSIDLKEEIEKAIKDKFNETSDILNDFNWEFDNSDELEKYFLYAMLKKKFQFEKEFKELDNGTFGKYENVSYFGIEDSEEKEIRNQVKVLYYKSGHYSIRFSSRLFALKIIRINLGKSIKC